MLIIVTLTSKNNLLQQLRLLLGHQEGVAFPETRSPQMQLQYRAGRILGERINQQCSFPSDSGTGVRTNPHREKEREPPSMHEGECKTCQNS